MSSTTVLNIPGQAAGAIHGDFERGFICADVMAYDVLKEIGSEGAVKAAGKLRQEGKNYVVADGGAPGLVYLVTTDVMMLCLLPWHISDSHYSSCPAQHSSLPSDCFNLLLLQTFATSSSTSPARRRSDTWLSRAKVPHAVWNHSGSSAILSQAETAGCPTLYLWPAWSIVLRTKARIQQQCALNAAQHGRLVTAP